MSPTASRLSIGAPEAIVRPQAHCHLAGGLKSPKPLKGNRLCQRLRSPCAASPWSSWASARRQAPSAKAQTLPPSTPIRAWACPAVRLPNMAASPHTRSSIRSDLLPAGRHSTPGGRPWAAAAPLLRRAVWRQVRLRPSPATRLDPICPRRRRARSRAGSWPFPKSAAPGPRAPATRRPRRRDRRKQHLP